jgi:hypothetical protein
MTGLRYLYPPTIAGKAMFSLVDDSGAGVPRQIYTLDLNAAPWAYPQKNSAIFQQLIADASIPFGNLTVSAAPLGCTMEIDVA